MRLSSFQIKNYRSIVDSGEVHLSDIDNVTVLAGQNESGKSSLLSALRDFENASFDPESEPFTTEESPEQSILCTFVVESSDNLVEALTESLINHHGLKITESEKILDAEKVKKIDKFSLTRTNKGGKLSFSVDDKTFKLFNAAILDKPQPQEVTTSESEDPTSQAPTSQKYIVFSEDQTEVVANIFFSATPTIVFFDDFCDLLPDNILISDLNENKSTVPGYQAVKNLEKILNVDFVKKDSETDPVRRTKEDTENTNLSINFQKDWGQRIHGENEVLVEYNFEKRNGAGADGSYINFFVQTKKGQRLPPKKRSKGLIWFLSLWLELHAQDVNNNDLILLLDEPDQHLHVKAQNDILKLINKLAGSTDDKGDQIIYATHSPYLIESDHLNRIKLVINDEKDGTKVEDIVSSKINTEYKRDALQPISDAIGLSVSAFATLNEKNVLLEGVSDFYYFSAMQKVLNRAGDYKFVPGIGVRQINNLISLCIGYGLQWCSIIDDDPTVGGKDSKKKFEEIKDAVFDGDETKAKEKVDILDGIVGIENMFTHDDLVLVNDKLGRSSDMVKAVGQKRKILFSKLFFEKVESGDITEDKLSTTAVDNFTKAFDFIQKGLNQ